jgi:hypothetical protein
VIDQHKIISDLSAQDALPGALGAGTASIGAASLNGWINDAYVLLSLFAIVVGAILTLFTIVNVYYKIRKNMLEIKALKDKGEE